MAILPIQVPQGKPKKDAMDRILQGLQIAETVFKIPVNISTLQTQAKEREALEQKAPLERASLEADTAAKVAETKRQDALLSDQQNKLRAETAKLRADTAAVMVPGGNARLAKLPVEERKRVDSTIMGLNAVNDMMKAYDAGNNTFSLIGDNDFTFAKNRFVEAIGRLQSGGAINKEEAARFMSFVPGPTDPTDMQIKKLNEARREMSSRLKNAGFAEDQFGIDGYAMKSKPGQLIPDAVAGNRGEDLYSNYVKRLGGQGQGGRNR